MRNRKKQTVISVPNPCHEDWNKMPAKDNGRFCNQCQRTIVDFSDLGDQELITFLSDPKKIACGRFAPHQLNRNLVPQKQRQIYFPFQKAIAAFLAFASLKNVTATSNQNSSAVVQTPKLFHTKNLTTGKVTIAGRVTDAKGEPIENATVYFDGKEVAKTDKEGAFSFETNAEDDQSKFSLLTVHYPGYVKAARTYYPSMLSTSYHIVMWKPADVSCLRNGTMGFPVFIPQLDSVSLTFKAGAQLTDSMRTELTRLASQMRNCPNITVQIVGYGTESNEVVKQRQQNIKMFLVGEQGISEDRFSLKIKPALLVRKNLIQIVPAE